MAYTRSSASLAMLLVVVIASGCQSEQDQLDAHKAAATQLLVENSQLREFLENDLYELSGNVFITTNQSIGDMSAIILSDGKLVIPDGYDLEWYEAVKQYEPIIVQVFDKFDCETIYLGDVAGKRILHIYLGQFKSGDDSLWEESLDYSSDGGTFEMSVSVFADWYYSALLQM
jgi:hypothetical protein